MAKKLITFLLFLPLFSFGGSQDFSATQEKRHERLRDKLKEDDTKHFMTGDWKGARSFLLEKGVSITSSFTTDTVANPIGGKARGISYAGSLGLDLRIDFEKITRLKGWVFYGAVVWRTGTSLSMRKIDNQFPVQQVYGSQTVKLDSFYLQKTAFDEKFLFRMGRLNGGDTFLQSPLFYNYVNNAFDGNPISVFFSTPFTAYPNAVWGTFLKLKPHSKFEFKMGVYQGNQQINQNKYHGIAPRLSSPQGVLFASEAAFLNNPGKRGLPGNYKLGFFYITKGKGLTLSPSKKETNHVLYLHLDQMFFRKKQRDLTAFTSLVFMPNEKNLLPWFFISGLVSNALFLKRENDTTSLGVAYGSYSSKIAAKSFELVLEANHNFQINPWFWFQPALQYIVHPKGNSHVENAWVLGFQSKLVF